MPIQDKNGNNIATVNVVKAGVTTSISTVIVVKAGVSTTVFSTVASPPPATPPPATPPPATPPPATPPPATPPPATPPPATPPPATPPPATPPPSLCLDINTPIHMYDGTTKLLKDVVVGDVLLGYYVPGMIPENVLGWEEWTESLEVEGYQKATTVVETKYGTYPEYYIVNNDIRITKKHPFLATKKDSSIWSWIDPPDLQIGDYIKGIDNFIEVTSVVQVNESLTVISMDVEEKDTYFAGNTPMVVHNNIGKEPAP